MNIICSDVLEYMAFVADRQALHAPQTTNHSIVLDQSIKQPKQAPPPLVVNNNFEKLEND